MGLTRAGLDGAGAWLITTIQPAFDSPGPQPLGVNL